MNRNYSIAQLGSIAHACLAHGQSGKILAAFSKAIYFQSDSGELFWMTTPDTPLHQRGVQTIPDLPILLAGSTFTVKGNHLIINSGITFDIPDAPAWHSPSINTVLPIPLLSSRIQVLFSNIELSHATGFGSFIPRILSLDFSTTVLPVPADPVLRFAQPLVLDIAGICLEHQPSRMPSIGRSLIGLGTGLTPSGDDFLGGMLFALKILKDLYPDQFTGYAIHLEHYRTLTQLISFTLLNDLSHGHALAPLHSIINGLLSGEPLETIYPSVSQLTKVGHSTGWDLLTGLLTGLLVTYRGNYFTSSFHTAHTIEV